jgi:antitoxin MazE
MYIFRTGARMQVSKWGNSLAIRIPAAVAEALQLREGDEIEVHVAGRRRFEIARNGARERALDRIRAFKKPLPPGWQFDREEANARRAQPRENSSTAM